MTGRLFNGNMEVTLGAAVAENTGLKVGDTFQGTHGESEEGHVHEDQDYQIVGVLNENNSVLDQLILTEIESVWEVHAEEGHHHDHEHNHEHPENEDKEITALLLKCKSKLEMMSLPAYINKQTNMQAVLPGLEINRLFYMLGIGATTIKLIGAGIMLMAGLSVLFVLYGRLRERKHELALMRSVGYSPFKLFNLLLIEGFLLAVIGYVLGTLVSRLGLIFINNQAASEFNMQIDSGFTSGEWGLMLGTLALGIIAALIPAIKAMRMNVSTILSEK